MRCPNCGTELKIAERQGIEIDYCPQCRGVWLDRGELDKLIERATATTVPFQGQGQPQTWGYGSSAALHHSAHDDDDDHYYRQPAAYGYQNQPYNNGQPYKKRKREGFLGELFDFD